MKKNSRFKITFYLPRVLQLTLPQYFICIIFSLVKKYHYLIKFCRHEKYDTNTKYDNT